MDGTDLVVESSNIRVLQFLLMQGDQRKRDAQGFFGHSYAEAVSKLRTKNFGPKEKGVPLEVCEAIASACCNLVVHPSNTFARSL